MPYDCRQMRGAVCSIVQFEREILVKQKLIQLNRRVNQPQVLDIAETVKKELSQLNLSLLRGKSVAITAGSRGIPNIVQILGTAAAVIKESGANPFIVPCMGSHGAGSAEGQIQVLAKLGIDEQSMGCAIRSDMQTEKVGILEGQEVVLSKLLLNADQILVVNRAKLHTAFVGCVESGLCKMLSIGAGHHSGAWNIHRLAEKIGFEHAILGAAEQILSLGKVFGGIGIVDNADKDTALIKAASAENFIDTDKFLIAKAKEYFVQLPFPFIDIVWLREMGKNISGTGSDPNVIAKSPAGWRKRVLPRDNMACITQLLISNLTTVSAGNGIGVGLADKITDRLYQAINWEPTRINAETSGGLNLLEEPPRYKNDFEMLQAAVNDMPADNPHIVFAQNTSELRNLWATSNCRELIKGNSDIEIIAELDEIPFDRAGNLALEFK